MSKPEEPITLEEWLTLGIQELIKSQGRVEAFRDGTADDKMAANAKNTWEWLAFLHEQILELTRALQTENNRYRNLRRQFVMTIGLDEGSSNEEIAKTAKEMRDIFTEMRRVRGERTKKFDNET